MLTDGQTDGRRTDTRVTGILIDHLGAFDSGELIRVGRVIGTTCIFCFGLIQQF